MSKCAKSRLRIRATSAIKAINHGVPLERRLKMETAVRKFFVLGNKLDATKHTKNVRDWKEVLDLTMEDPTVMWASHEPEDQELTEWFNLWPENVPELRYF
ncbi:hypothetical protein LguiA_008892 [Lonicera macranthoides]